MNRTRWTTTLALALIYLVLWSFSAHAQTPNPVTPGYQICRTTDLGNTQCSFQPTDLTHGLPVNLVAGSVSASLAPFTPAAAGARGTPLVVSTVDVTGTIPTNTGAVVLSNPGATVAYCNLNNVAATTADYPIAPGGGAVAFGVPAAITVFRCISTGAGTTINSVGGSGLGAFTGGGGGSGGGGAVTIAAGADVTTGNTTDAACAGDSTSGCTVESRLIRIAQNLTTVNTTAGAAVPAGTNNIGSTSPAPNVTATACSGTIATGGTAQSAIVTQTTLHGFTIANIDTTEPLWISFTGTAAASGTDSYPLPAATASTFAGFGSFTSPPGFGLNHALSVIAATSTHKYSCTWW